MFGRCHENLAGALLNNISHISLALVSDPWFLVPKLGIASLLEEGLGWGEGAANLLTNPDLQLFSLSVMSAVGGLLP